MPKTLCFDLDGTLCNNTFGDYESAQPVPWAIERLNALALAGHRIVILTARGSATGIDWREPTRAQLKRWGVHYDELAFGKPSADVYVDDRAVHVDAWRTGDAFDPPGFCGDGSSEALPTVIAGPVSCIVETGRTFGGKAFRLHGQVRRLQQAAACAGVRTPDAAALVARVRARLAACRPQAADDVVYSVIVAGASTAAGPPSGVTVTCRPLGTFARALTPSLAPGSGEVRVLAEVCTEPRPPAGAWPLLRTPDGSIVDGLGGQLALVRDAALQLQPAPGPPSVAGAWLESLAAAHGMRCEQAPVTADDLVAADEALIAGPPFCLLPVAAVDGRSIGEPVVGMRLLEAWGAEVGVDLAAQTAELARGAEVARA